MSLNHRLDRIERLFGPEQRNRCGTCGFTISFATLTDDGAVCPECGALVDDAAGTLKLYADIDDGDATEGVCE